MPSLDAIWENYICTGELSREEIVHLLELEDNGEQARLLNLADRVRRENLGDEVHLRGIIEFSNYCVRDCLYCGIRRSNRKLVRYRMTPDEIVATAAQAVAMGFKTVVLQSGDDFYYTGPMIAEIIRAVKEMGVAVTVSAGERPRTDYAQWREAGADRYLLKFETSDAALYNRLHPGTSLGRRLRCLRDLRELGYQLGSGNMVGLPGQTPATLADDILLMGSLQLEMAGIGPFLPHPATPLQGTDPGTMSMTLKVLAIARLLMPRAHLPATTALGSVNVDGRRAGLLAGANVLMLNLTPLEYRSLYEIYPAKAEIRTEPARLKAEAEELIHSLGRQVSTGYGHGYLHEATNVNLSLATEKPPHWACLARGSGSEGRG